MSGLTRKEMKRDEVREWMEVAMEWIVDNVRLILGVFAGIAAVVALVVLSISVMNKRAERAQDVLGDALRLVNAPIDAVAATPDDPTAPSFSTEEARTAAAKAAFTGVLDDHGSSDAANIAKIYLGTFAANEGDLATARERWTESLAGLNDSALSASVRLNLLSLDRQEGKHAEIIESLEGQLESTQLQIPADVILFELARALEATGEDEQAQDRYQQLIDEHPASRYAATARNLVNAAG